MTRRATWIVAAVLAAGAVLVPGMGAQAGADLTVEAIDSTALNTDTQTMAVTGSLQVTIRNLGGSAAGAFTVRAFEDRNGNAIFDASADVVFGEATVASIGPLAAVPVSVAVTGTQTFSGNIIHVQADGAGVVTETDETNNLRHTGQSSTFTVVGGDALAPVILWQRETFTQQPVQRRVRSTPAVGDLDGDGYPEVAFNSGAILRVLDGRTGAERFNVVDATLRVDLNAGVSFADLNRDGTPEILTMDQQCRAIVFNADGTLRWRAAEVGYASCWTAVTIADLDADGSPEVIAGDHVYTSTGTHLWSASERRGGPFGSMPVVADIDLDGSLDVVMGPSAYGADGTLLYDRSSSYNEAYPAVGNLDADPEAEIVFKMRSPSTLVVLEHDGTTKWAVPWSGVAGGGAPTIADFDGDGVADIGVSGTSEYRVYRADATLMWSNAIYDTSSGVTSSTVFDFDADGNAEVVFADEEYLYIWRGADGAELFRTPRGSTTGAESPVVVDVDADGHADIVVPRDGRAGLAAVDTYGVAVYTGANRNWANTRQIWNQPSYSITHVNDDLTIPTTFTPNWRVDGLNNFRLNTFDPRTGAAPDSAPNLTASFLRNDDREFPGRTFLTVRIGNGGAVQAPESRVVLAADDLQICALATSRALQPGEFEDLTCVWTGPAAGPRRVVATVDPDGLIAEGDEGDNTAAALLLVGIGPAETVDTLVVRARDRGAELRWTPMAGAVAYNIYRKVEGGTYALHRASYVNGMSTFVDSRLTNNVVHWYQVRWLDAGGNESPLGTEASATPIPRAQRGDTAPTILSQPVTRGRTDAAYAYQVVASDPDPGDVLTCTLLAPPAGMTIDAGCAIAWTPEVAQAGPQRVQVAITDTRGRVTSQAFNAFVETQFVNTAPTITSTAITSATAGREYAYTVVASDPDAGDIVAFVLDEGPVGLSIHPASGRVTWMPAVGDVGAHLVSVTARDLSGYTDTQNFQVAVGNPNRQPTITSVAPTLGTVGATLSYPATATDPDAGDVLGWTLVSGPEGATLAGTGQLLFTPTAVGQATFTIEVSDLLGAFARQTFTVQVGAVTNAAPVFTSTAVTEAEVDALYGYAARATDPDGDTVHYSLVTGPAGMTMTPEGVLYWTPGAAGVGDVAISVRASDPHGGVATQSFVVTVAPIDSTAPVVGFSSPDAEAVVDGHVPIVGTASDANLVSWTLEYQVAGDTRWVRLAEGDASIEDEVLATFPAGLLANRPYVLKLSALDRRQGAVTQRRLTVGGSPLKLGAFTLEYTDLRVPAGTMPISVQRRYDSSRAYWNDFGTGWALGFSEIDLRVDGAYNVFLTLPSGREAAFQFAPLSLGFAGVSENRYLPGVGVFDTLENLDCPNLLGSGSVLCLAGVTPIGPYQPRRWRLTTADGTAYTIEDARITRVEDRNGQWTSIGATGISTSTGQSVQFVRDGSGRITQMIDARGTRLLYGYDGHGRLSSVTDQADVVTTYTYDGDSHLITQVTGEGGCQALRQEFDGDGRLSARVDANGARTSFSYDIPGRGLTTTYADGTTTMEVFNEVGDPVRFVDGESHVMTYAYDANRQRVLTEMPSGRRLTRTYDASGNPLTASSGRAGGAQLTTAYTWTADNLLARLTYPNGEYDSFEYDVRGNLIGRRVHAASGDLVRAHLFAYDAAGRVIGEQSDLGTFSYAYDTGGRLSAITDGAGRVSHMAYDATGQLVTTFGPDGAPFSIDYDAYGLPIAYRADQVLLYTQSWNAFGSLADATDGAGGTFAFAYDCSGGLTSVDDPVGGHTAYGRNPFGAWTSRTDALGRQSQRTYDRNGRLLASTSPAGDQVSHTWSPDGAEASRTTSLGTVAVTFDDHGRPLVQTEPDRARTYAYDGRGRVTSIVTTGAQAGSHATVWDAAGAPLSVTDRFGYTVTYTYDQQGRRTTMTSPDGLVTTYTYDAGGRLARLATGGAWADFTWDAAGRRTSVAFSNGVRGDRAYASDGRLQSLTWTGPGGTVIRSWSYSYDAAGRPVHASLNDGSVNWTYDALGRLTSETIASAVGGDRSAAWSYDVVGNRLDAGATYGDDHRQLTHGGVGYAQTFDAAGNARRAGTGSIGYLMAYDVFNRLVSTPFGDWRYNAVGMRDETTVGTDRRYLYDGLNPLAMATATTMPHRYTYGLEVDDILFAHNAGAIRFYVTDHAGSVVALTDEAGGVVRRHAYDAWGVLYHSSNVSNINFGLVNHNPYLFQAREYQTGVNLYDYRARAYDPALGRFLQKDPDPGVAWLPASRHPYQFALNSPTLYGDPLGESAVQYSVLIRRNPLAMFGGAMAGFGAAFTGTTLSYLGHFLEAHLADPSGALSGKSASALSSANSQMGEVLKKVSKLGKETSVGKGMKLGTMAGKFAASYWIGMNVP